MREAVLLTKLEQLQNCIQRIESKRPLTAETLKKTYDVQDVVSLNLQRAIQICVDIAALIISESQQRAPETMADSFDTLKNMKILSSEVAGSLIKAVGLRNILVHEYEEVNWEVVATVANSHLDVFKEFAKTVLTLARP